MSKFYRIVVLFAILLISYFSTSAQDTALVSKKIISFCNAHIGKKVGKGECWDLAKEALDFSGAQWTPPYGFGRKLSENEIALPGDIIQFEKVKIVYPNKNWTELPHHTAVIYKITSHGKYTLAEQNANNKKIVSLSEIDLNFLKTGKFTIYRPQ